MWVKMTTIFCSELYNILTTLCDKITLALIIVLVGALWYLVHAHVIHCKNKRVDVTHLGLSELHVHTSRSVIFLDHCRSPISDKRYSIKS